SDAASLPLSLHDALPICVKLIGWFALASLVLSAGCSPPSADREDAVVRGVVRDPLTGEALADVRVRARDTGAEDRTDAAGIARRSEEHTSELQSREKLVC